MTKFEGFDLARRQEVLFSEAERLLAKLVEIAPGGSMPPGVVKQMQQRFQALCQQLGVWDDETGLTPEGFGRLSVKLMAEKQVAEIAENLPTEEEIAKALSHLKQERPDITWGQITPRGVLSLPAYLRSLAAVMADKLVYTLVFKGDPIEWDSKRGVPSNGRHRWLTMLVFEQLGYEWVDFSWRLKE